MAQAKKKKTATDVKKEIFLEALLNTGIVAEACRLAKLNRRSLYRWREADQAFADEWDSTVKTALRERLIEASYEPKNPAVLIFMGKAILGLSDGAGEIDELRQTIRELQVERERMRLVVYRACRGNPKLRDRISAEIAAFDDFDQGKPN